MDDTNKIFPKSVSKKQCLTDCYPKNIFIQHPITNEVLTDHADPFCATNKFEKNNKTMWIDKCHVPTVPQRLKHYHPVNFFKPNIFLNQVYNIDSLDAFILWFSDNDDY